MVEGLDVDPFTENIYWTEVTRGTVVVGHKNHNGDYERLVLARDLHSPKGITIASEFGKMFIVEGRISHVISVWHMDGAGHRKELVHVYGTVYQGWHTTENIFILVTLYEVRLNALKLEVKTEPFYALIWELRLPWTLVQVPFFG